MMYLFKVMKRFVKIFLAFLPYIIAEVLTQRMRARTLFQLSTIMQKCGRPALQNIAKVEV